MILYTTSTAWNGHHNVHMPVSLTLATPIYGKHYAVRTPRPTPYDGHFRVIGRNNKTFVIDHRGHHKTVTSDGLKPAFLEEPSSQYGTPAPLLPTATVPPSRITYRRRVIRPPAQLWDIFTVITPRELQWTPSLGDRGLLQQFFPSRDRIASVISSNVSGVFSF